jgi:cell division protein FtsB
MARRQRNRTKAPVRLHPGRLAVLVLGIVAAYFFVSPLRAFFAQQDRYHTAVAALQDAKQENAALKQQAQLLGTKRYIAQRARADSLLVPLGTQAFVVKGLPDEDEAAKVTLPDDQPATASVSVLERVEDLWRTLFD